jgi:signal transduction histidine kinase
LAAALAPTLCALAVPIRDTDVAYSSAEFLSDYRGATPPPPDQPGNRVALPVSLPGERPAGSPLAYWFRLKFRLDVDPLKAYSVYIPYASPNIAVYLNGTFVGANRGFGAPRNEAWNFPQLFRLTAPLLPGENQLLLKIQRRTPGTVELGTLMLGVDAMLYPRYQRQLWLQVIGVEVVSLLVGLIGLLAGMVWWQRRSEIVFGLFSLSCMLWIVRNAQFFMSDTLVPPFYFGLITNGALFWLVAILYTLCFRILGRSFPRIERALFGFALAVTLAIWIGGPAREGDVLAIAYVVISLPSFAFLAYLTAVVARSGTVLLRLLWLSAVVSSCTGAYDLMLMQERIPWPGAYYMPYSALVYAATVGWALVDRFVKTQRQYEHLNSELETRVHSREQELAAHYARTTQIESERVIADERERILRDMHDGLGMQLISSMRLVEKGELTREQTVGLLVEAMDELRLAIDAVKPTAGDLLIMLGNLRYRLEPRLRSAGIELDWHIAPALRLEFLSSGQVTEITRIVQEAFSNAMKHSRASRMSLGVSTNADEAVQISVTDNGRGFAPDAQGRGEGLKNMGQRARKIGGTLQIDSRPGETTVRLTF